MIRIERSELLSEAAEFFFAREAGDARRRAISKADMGWVDRRSESRSCGFLISLKVMLASGFETDLPWLALWRCHVLS